jgi:hypothetical protein
MYKHLHDVRADGFRKFATPEKSSFWTTFKIVFETARLLFWREAEDSGKTPGDKTSGRRIFADVVFGQTILKARREANVVAISVAFWDDDVDVEHDGFQLI